MRSYGSIYASDQRISELTADTYVAVLREFEQYRDLGTILDIGCGAGDFLALATARGWKATGTEVVPTAGVVAREAGATVAIGDRATRQLPSEAFDIVTLWEVIEHVDDPTDVLSEAHRLCRSGGILFLTTPNHASLQRRLLGRRWPRFHPEHLTYYDPRSLREAIARAGFRASSIASKNFDPFVLLSVFGSGAIDDPERRRGPVVPEAPSGRAARGREVLRRVLKRTPAGRFVGRSVNAALRITGLGDTLVARAQRPADRSRLSGSR